MTLAVYSEDMIIDNLFILNIEYGKLFCFAEMTVCKNIFEKITRKIGAIVPSSAILMTEAVRPA